MIPGHRLKEGVGYLRGREYRVAAWVKEEEALKVRFVSQDEPRSWLRRLLDLPPRRRAYAIPIITNGAGRELLALARLELKECRI